MQHQSVRILPSVPSSSPLASFIPDSLLTSLPTLGFPSLGLFSSSGSGGRDGTKAVSFGLRRLLGVESGAGSGVRQVAGAVLVVIASLLIMEQVIYRQKKAHLPGATWTIPVIGKFSDSMNPLLDNYKKAWEWPMSVVSVFNIFIVIASSNDLSRKILNSPNHTEPCLTSAAKKILLKENWVFLHGKVHADYRKALNVLFTKRALSIYLPIQEQIYRKYFKSWLNDPNPDPQAYMLKMRDLNMETSLRVFCGSHISEAAAQQISDQYWLITLALQLVNFPLAVPGTNVYNSIKARKAAMIHLTAAAASSKARMASGTEPECLLDEWMSEMIKARGGEGEDEQRRILSREYSDHEIAMVVLSFLFASQDAMSSAIVYLFQLTADHPEVLAKIREEQMMVRGGDVEAPTTLQMVDDMVYTRACVKEGLRLMPPVIMVPYLTKKPFPITDDYTVPKNTMIIPSFWNSLHDETIYPQPDSFIPERWMPLPEGGVPLAETSPQNYLVWGSGPHKCIGIQYASMHLAAVVGAASVLMDWDHEITPDSGKVNVICTIFPQDGLRLKFRPRTTPIPGYA